MLRPCRSSAELLERLLGFDTQSFRSNLELIDFVRAHLGERGVEARLVHDDGGTKANLWAVIGPRDVPGIVLSGHTDVVPVAGQAWTERSVPRAVRGRAASMAGVPPT